MILKLSSCICSLVFATCYSRIGLSYVKRLCYHSRYYFLLFFIIIILIQEYCTQIFIQWVEEFHNQVQVGSRIIGYSPEYVPRVWILEWRLGHAVSSNILEPAQVFCHISLSVLHYLDHWASSLLSMSYKPQAEFYYSCKTVKDPFGIERDEILPGLLQI